METTNEYVVNNLGLIVTAPWSLFKTEYSENGPVYLSRGEDITTSHTTSFDVIIHIIISYIELTNDRWIEMRTPLKKW